MRLGYTLLVLLHACAVTAAAAAAAACCGCPTSSKRTPHSRAETLTVCIKVEKRQL